MMTLVSTIQRYPGFLKYGPLVGILLVAAILRVAAAVYLGNSVSGLSGAYDEISYSVLGQRFADGYGMTFPSDWYPWIKAGAPQSYYSYAMSFLLASIYILFGYEPLVARLVMALLSILIVLMIFLVTKMLFDRQVAFVAAALAAVYAYLIFYGATLVTETPFILLLLISIYAALKLAHGGRPIVWIVVLGVALALTVLLRMAVIFFVPFLLLWLYLNLPHKQHRILLLIPIGIIIMAITPFTLRNIRLWDHFMVLESQFGHVFWNGNHPGHGGDFHPFEVFPIPPEVLASQNDAIMTNTLLRMGLENIANNPADFASLTLTRLREFFTFWPTAQSTPMANALRIISFGILMPFMVGGLLLNLPRWRTLILVYLFILIHTGVYAISWTMIRYRIPLDVFFIMFAASAIMALFRAWQRRRVRDDSSWARSPV